jgi:hypothetical protein
VGHQRRAAGRRKGLSSAEPAPEGAWQGHRA